MSIDRHKSLQLLAQDEISLLGNIINSWCYSVGVVFA